MFEELVAASDETSVRHSQTWLFFFDSPVCRRCNEIGEVFLDLSNVPEMVSEFKMARVVCPKAHSVCHRLGVKGFPTISVLQGNFVYDYQGKMRVGDLSRFITEKEYLKRSKARRITHVMSPVENLFQAATTARLKMRLMTMYLFKAFGLGHLEEEFVIQLVFVCALAPFVLYLIALVIERRQLQ